MLSQPTNNDDHDDDWMIFKGTAAHRIQCITTDNIKPEYHDDDILYSDIF